MTEGSPTISLDDLAEALDPQILLVSFHHAESGWRSDARSLVRPVFDLWFIESGRGRVRIDGKWIAFQKNDMIIMKPGQTFQEEETEPDCSYEMYYLHFHPFGRRNPSLDTRLASILPAKMSFRLHGQLGALFSELFEVYAVQPSGYRLCLKACALHILGIVFANLRSAQSLDGLASYPRAQAAREFVIEHYRQRISLRQIAAVAGLSQSYLSALFRKYFGTSPIEYQITVRLQEAKLLLAQGRSVSRTAEQVGFSSIHYFSRVFKESEGISPRDFTRRFKRWPLTENTGSP